MIDDAQSGDAGASANASDYRWVFLQRVHGVLQAGYLRLNPSDYASSDEPTISGVLAGAMRAYLREDAPDWADHFSVHDDPPVTDGTRTGKRRNRIDIGVESSTPRPGQRFSFEAKRLGPGNSVGKYLGPDGLGCFLSGKYARQDDAAGMLGYVQSDSPAQWASKIQAGLQANVSVHGTSASRCWASHAFATGPEFVFASNHDRPAVGRPIAVYHSLLSFMAT